MSKAKKPTPLLRSASGRFYLWAEIVVRSRAQPGQWWLPLPAVPVATAVAIRERRRRELKHDDGRLEVDVRNPYKNEMGRDYCDCYVRWVPAEGEA